MSILELKCVGVKWRVEKAVQGCIIWGCYWWGITI